MKILFIIIIIVININTILSQQIKIVDQSKSSVYCNGDNATIWIDADGNNLVYNWFKDGIPIPDATTRFLNIIDLNNENSGVYYCIVTSQNNSDSVRSKDIAVYIATPTRFIRKPYNVKWVYGKTIEFVTQLHTNDLNELRNIKIQWYKEIFDVSKQMNVRTLLKDDKKFAGTKTERLSIKSLVWSDRAFYICIAIGLCGSDSVKAYIGDDIYFKIIKETGDFKECEGQDAVFRVKVEQLQKGTIEYQWFNPGFKKIEESSKFEGTRTRQLTIHNVKKEDNNQFYVLVTIKEYDVSERSASFDLVPKYTPFIWIQPKDFIIKNKENLLTKINYIYAVVSNLDYCTYEWYRNDTLVANSLSLYGSNFQPSQKSDLGIYKCRISNECGSIWTDSAYVIWGIEDTQTCLGHEVSIISENLNSSLDSSFYYIWKKDGTVISDNYRIHGSNTYELHITETNSLDSGFYEVYSKNFKTNKEMLLGKSYLTVAITPYILKQLPDTIKYEDAKWLPKNYLTVFSYGPSLYYQLFKDDQPYSDEEKISIYNIFEQLHPFLFGGYVNFPKGKYYYIFRNSCGKVKSKDFVIINDFVSGTVKPDSFQSLNSGDSFEDKAKEDNISYLSENNSEINRISVIPNPAIDFFEININSFYDEFAEVELFDNLGKLVFKVKKPLFIGSNKIDINISYLNLPNNLYYIIIKSDSKISKGNIIISK